LNRRSFITVSAATLGTLITSTRFQDLWGQTPSTSFESLRGNVGIFLGRGGTIGWFVSSDAVIVIDSQFPETAEVCLDGVNQRSGDKPIDFLINTHHHGDHTAGNSVFRSRARKIVAHEKVPELLKLAASRNPNSPSPTLPDTTFSTTWQADLGDETVSAKHYGPAHTGGDIAIHFEKANVIHLGDLMFNRRHPFIDRPAGALIKGWIGALEKIVAEHSEDALFIFGHAGDGWKVTGNKSDLLYQRDYFTALLEHTEREIKSGKGREEIVNATPVLKGFSDHGPLISRVLSVAYDESTD
jgi:glyoxylase-like metal-dependent hydrolase (beta-lactamase superfamily II)